MPVTHQVLNCQGDVPLIHMSIFFLIKQVSITVKPQVQGASV